MRLFSRSPPPLKPKSTRHQPRTGEPSSYGNKALPQSKPPPSPSSAHFLKAQREAFSKEKDLNIQSPPQPQEKRRRGPPPPPPPPNSTSRYFLPPRAPVKPLNRPLLSSKDLSLIPQRRPPNSASHVGHIKRGLSPIDASPPPPSTTRLSSSSSSSSRPGSHESSRSASNSNPITTQPRTTSNTTTRGSSSKGAKASTPRSVADSLSRGASPVRQAKDYDSASHSTKTVQELEVEQDVMYAKMDELNRAIKERKREKGGELSAIKKKRKQKSTKAELQIRTERYKKLCDEQEVLEKRIKQISQAIDEHNALIDEARSARSRTGVHNPWG